MKSGVMYTFHCSLVDAAQEVAVPQHTVQPPGPQVVFQHVGSTVDVGKTCRQRLIDTVCLGKRILQNSCEKWRFCIYS